MTIKAVLTDIEGTTTSVAFVVDVLFPYARARLDAFVAVHPDMVANVLGDNPVATLHHWMTIDAKEPALKSIQGRIWAEGYGDGTLRGHVYADAATAFRRWHGAEIPIYIFSSGSVAAQKLLFANSVAGDLTPCLAGYFDTSTGPKRDPATYEKIVRLIGLPAADILFLSDTAAEVEAARTAGMSALRIDRDGAAGDIASFDAVGL